MFFLHSFYIYHYKCLSSTVFFTVFPLIKTVPPKNMIDNVTWHSFSTDCPLRGAGVGGINLIRDIFEKKDLEDAHHV